MCSRNLCSAEEPSSDSVWLQAWISFTIRKEFSRKEAGSRKETYSSLWLPANFHDQLVCIWAKYEPKLKKLRVRALMYKQGWQ